MKDDEGSTSKQFKDFLKLSDFNLVCTLYCLGFDIIGIDNRDYKRVIFFYEKTTDLEVKVKEYFQHKVRVDPLEFDRSMREIRSRIRTGIDEKDTKKYKW